MATKKKSLITSWQENYAGLILGAIIVIILGLLVANFFTKRNEEIESGEQIDLTEEVAGEQTAEQYKVAEGDSLSKISEKFYDTQELWPYLAQVNKIANPNVIFADSTLEIPDKENIEELKTQMTQTTYKVKEGETLFTIAEKVYGNGSKWTILDRANQIGRLPNGNPLVYAESTLVIPR